MPSPNRSFQIPNPIIINADTLVDFPVTADDHLWFYATNDLATLSDLACDPYTWVKSKGNAAFTPTIADNFVIIFKVSSLNGGGTQPAINYLVEGIDGTGCITVTISNTAQSASSPLPIPDPADPGTLITLEVNGCFFWHLDDSKSTNLRNYFVSAMVLNPNHYIGWINSLVQHDQFNQVRAANESITFMAPTNPAEINFVVEGTKALVAGNPGAPDTTCNVGDAGTDGQGNVIVNGVIVKTYPQPTPPPGSE